MKGLVVNEAVVPFYWGCQKRKLGNKQVDKSRITTEEDYKLRSLPNEVIWPNSFQKKYSLEKKYKKKVKSYVVFVDQPIFFKSFINILVLSWHSVIWKPTEQN